MKRKQLLALLLVITMMIGMTQTIISFAEITEECVCFVVCPQCSSTKVGMMATIDDAWKEPYGGNPELHLLIFPAYAYCLNCGYTGEVHVHKNLNVHKFNFIGICECGYQKEENGCQHLKHDNDILFRTEVRKISTNDKVHEKRYVYTHECEDCGILLPDVYSEWFEESHNFTTTITDTGIRVEYCVDCNFNKNYSSNVFCGFCKSYNIDMKIVRKEIEIKTAIPNIHQINYEYWNECRDCGEGNRSSASIREQHTFDETGVCFVCGYEEPACTHANEKWDDVYVPDLTTFEITDEQNHLVILTYKRYCKDCGEYVNNGTDDGYPEAHDFTKGDTCWICGYLKEACPHATFTDKYDNGALKPIFSNITETHHDVQNGYMRYCEDCKQYTGETGYFDAVPEEHDFTNGDVCVCGYDRTYCVHANKTAYYDSSIQPIFENITETQHDVRNGYQMICDACEEATGETGYFDAVSEQHDFTNGDVCICGYDRTYCAHTNKTAHYDSSIQPIFENITETQHDVRNGYQMICDACEEATGETGYFDAVSEQHIFSNGDVCVCGYDRNNCAHRALEGSTEHVKTYFEAEDASTHKAVADDYKYICSKCFKTVVEKVLRSEEGVEKGIPHAWDDSGKCQSNGCGYGCAHTGEWIKGDTAIIGTGKFLKISDSEHKRISVDYEYTCANCGFKEIRNTPEDGEIKAHLMKWLNSRYEISEDKSKHRIVGQKVCSWTADGETHYCHDEDGNRHIKDAKGAWVEHTPNTVSSDKTDRIHVYKDNNVHVVSEGTITYCVCGTWLSHEYSEGYEEDHIDENKDHYCDRCERLMSSAWEEYNTKKDMTRFDVPVDVFDKGNITKAIFLNAQENADIFGFGNYLFDKAGWGNEIVEITRTETYTYNENGQVQTGLIKINGEEIAHGVCKDGEWIECDGNDELMNEYIKLFNANIERKEETSRKEYAAGHSGILLIDENGNGLLFEVGNTPGFLGELGEDLGNPLPKISEQLFGFAQLNKHARYISAYDIQQMLAKRNQIYRFQSDSYYLIGDSRWEKEGNGSSSWDNAIVFDVGNSEGTRMFEEVVNIFEDNKTYQLAIDDCDGFVMDVLLEGLIGKQREDVRKCDSAAPNGTYEKLEEYVKGLGDSSVYVYKWPDE